MSNRSKYLRGQNLVAFPADRSTVGTPTRSESLLPILVVLHQETSSPGRVGNALRALGYRLDIRRPRFGDVLPETLGGHAGAVIFGGPRSADEPAHCRPR